MCVTIQQSNLCFNEAERCEGSTTPARRACKSHHAKFITIINPLPARVRPRGPGTHYCECIFYLPFSPPFFPFVFLPLSLNLSVYPEYLPFLLPLHYSSCQLNSSSVTGFCKDLGGKKKGRGKKKQRVGPWGNDINVAPQHLTNGCSRPSGILLTSGGGYPS